eukprot:COSAG02_NODE_59615_length_274_cov_0.280000_1_plen_72_part_01
MGGHTEEEVGGAEAAEEAEAAEGLPLSDSVGRALVGLGLGLGLGLVADMSLSQSVSVAEQGGGTLDGSMGVV